MSNWKMFAAVVVVGAAVSAGVYAQPRGVKPLTPQDYMEIQQLYIRYTWAIDSHAENGMVYAKTFTPDGEFNIRGTKHVGWEKLAEVARARPNASAAAPHHYTTNITIEASPEGARGGAYYLSVPTPQPDKPASIITTGTYQDVLVKTADGWRFKSRTFYTNAMPPAAN